MLLYIFRRAEGVDAEIQIMDVQIEGDQAASFFIQHPVVPAPSGIAVQAAHLSGKKLSVFSGVIQLFDEQIFRPEAQHLGHHEADMVFTGCLIGAVHILLIQRDGLFADHVDAALHGFYRKVHMEEGGQADVQNVQLFLFQHFIKIRIMAFVRIGLHPLRTDIAQRDQLCIFHGVPGGDMGAADSPDADQTDF